MTIDKVRRSMFNEETTIRQIHIIFPFYILPNSQTTAVSTSCSFASTVYNIASLTDFTVDNTLEYDGQLTIAPTATIPAVNTSATQQAVYFQAPLNSLEQVEVGKYAYFTYRLYIKEIVYSSFMFDASLQNMAAGVYIQLCSVFLKANI